MSHKKARRRRREERRRAEAAPAGVPGPLAAGEESAPGEGEADRASVAAPVAPSPPGTGPAAGEAPLPDAPPQVAAAPAGEASSGAAAADAAAASGPIAPAEDTLADAATTPAAGAPGDDTSPTSAAAAPAGDASLTPAAAAPAGEAAPTPGATDARAVAPQSQDAPPQAPDALPPGPPPPPAVDAEPTPLPPPAVLRDVAARVATDGPAEQAAPPPSAPPAPPLSSVPRRSSALPAASRQPGPLRPVVPSSRVVRPEPAPPRARPLGTPRPVRTQTRRVAPPLPPDPGPRPTDARPARPVVKVTMAQAAAAGRQTVRTSPSVPDGLRRGRSRSDDRQLVPTTRGAAAPGAPARAIVAPPEPLDLPRPVAAVLGVTSVTSPACVAHVEEAARAVPGVVEAEASLAAGLVAVSGEADAAALTQALEASGHPVAQVAPGSPQALAESRSLALSALGAAAAGAISIALGDLAGSRPLAVLAAIAGVAAGHGLVPPVLRHLVRGRPCAELLPLISALLLLGLGVAGAAPPALAVLPVVGHLLAAALASRLRAAVLQVMERLREAVPEQPPPAGTVEVAAGERLPADGRLLSPAVLDESDLGGEEELDRGPGELVLAGTRARTPARFEVIAGGTRIADGVELARRALATHPRRTAAQLAARAVVPTALGVAVIAGALQGWAVAAAVLAAAAPLALGVSASLSGASGVVRALARGIAFRSYEALRRAGTVRTLVLDRGSLVLRGDASVTDVIARPGADEQEALRLAGAAEAGLDHPLARGIAAYVRDIALEVPAARDRRVFPGQGVEATVENRRIVVGSAQLATRLGLDVSQLEQSAEESARRGRTPLFVAVDGDVQVVIALGRTPHESTRRAFGSIENLGVEVELASADAAGSARWVAEVCGLRPELALGHAAPETARAHVASLRRHGPVAVAIGSENELPVLAAADLPVAVAGAKALRPAAAALILRPDPAAAVELVRAGRATRWALRISGAVGIAGTAAGLGLAAAGVLGPAGAAALALATSAAAMGIAAAPLAR